MNLNAPEPSVSLLGGLRKAKRDNGHSTTPLMDGISTISGATKIAASNTNKGKDASSAEFATFSSPTATESGRGKRSSLRVKVKGALRRMDGSLFGSSSNLVYRGDNDEFSTMSNIHSTHSGSTSFPTSSTSAMPTSSVGGGSGSNSNSTLLQTPSSSSTKQNSKSNLSTKFNASMRTFLSSMTPNRTPSLSPRRPSSKASNHRRTQMLTSIATSSNIVPTVPFDNDDDDDENDNNGVRSDSDSEPEEAEKANDTGNKSTTATTTTRTRSLSPARQKRQERRDRKKATKSTSSSSTTKVHSSNPRLRRRKYRRINTSQEASSPKGSSSKDDNNKSNNSKEEAGKKKLARSAPRSSSQKLIRVQEEVEGVPLIPGQTFLMSVLDDVQARMEASGELILQHQHQQESDNANLIGEEEEQEGVSSIKKTTKKKAKGNILRKRLGKKSKGSSSKEAEMALLAPESEREEKAREEVDALEMGFRRNFVSQESSQEELLGVEVSNSSGEEDDKGATSGEDAPPSLEAMMEPEDGDADTGDGTNETDDSEIPLMRRTRSELKVEVENSLKHFAPLSNPRQPLAEPPINILDQLEQAVESLRRDSLLTTTDFNYNFSNVASGNSPNSTMDDSVVLDIRAMENRRAREEKQLKRPAGILRGRSCSDLKEVSDQSTARASPWDHFYVGDSWVDLLDDMQTETQKRLDSGSQSSPNQHFSQPLRQLIRDTRPGRSTQTDRSVGSGSQRGRSRSSRKKSISANEAATATSKGNKGSGGRRNGVGERKKVQRRRTVHDDRENCTRAKERDKSKSTSTSQHSEHHRAVSQLPEGRERSKSHSRRGHKNGASKGREGSRSMRNRMSVSERRQHERKRDCCTIKVNDQSRAFGQPKTRDGGRINSSNNANNSSRRSSSLRDLRRELFEGSKSKSDSRIDTRYRSRSRSRSRSLRDLGSSAQAMEHRPARRCSESWIDYRRMEATRDRSKSSSRRLAKFSSRGGDHRMSRSEQGHSHRHGPIDPSTFQGGKSANREGEDCDRRETAGKAEVARVAPGKSSSAVLLGSEGNLKYHSRVQKRSKSGTFDCTGGKRDTSGRRASGGHVRSRRNSARGNHSDSAVGDISSRSSISKVVKRQRSRSLERARRSKKIVDNAKDEVEKLKRVSVSNELGSPSGRDLQRMARDSSAQLYGRSGGNKQLQIQRRKETKDQRKSGQDEKQKGRNPRHSGRARNGNNERRKLPSRRKSLEPSRNNEESNRNRDRVNGSRHSGRETSRTTGTGGRDPSTKTTGPEPKFKSVGHKERRSRISALRKDHESAVTTQKISGSQSERPTRSLDETVVAPSISSSERYERRVSFDTESA